MTSNSPQIAFLGIGLMGAPMTRNLLNAGFTMTLWNRTPAKCEPFSGEATIAESPAAAVANADIVITMLENGQVVEDVLVTQGTMDALKAGALVIDMSSVQPSLARRLGEMAAARGAGFVDAPVGAGQLAKLANQAIVGITIGAVSEALLLAAKGGADPAAVREALMGGFAGSRILELHGQRIIDREFAPGAPARIQLKDLRMILDEARAEGLTLPLAQQVHNEYLSLVANGHSDVDHSGLLLELEHLNGCLLGSKGRR